MSSTSSSECLCDKCLNYGPGLGSLGFRPGAPYYQTLGHPLIYYAQVQQTPNCARRSGESRQESPNCFQKAFRWYIQKRTCLPQNQGLPSEKTDLNGFAVWLDKKYDEYMLEQRAEQTALQIKSQRTSILETNKNCNSATCDVRIKKKFGGMRSPWKKRQRQEKCKDAGDVLDKCNQSFEFILKPKELSRPASDCCYNQPSCNRSNASAETQASKKTTILKSHSSDRTYEKHNFTPIEVTKPEGDSSVVSKLARTKSEVQPETGSKLSKLTKDVICQCPGEKIEVSDVEVQFPSSVDKKALKESPLSDRNKNDERVQSESTRVDKAASIDSPLSVKNSNGVKVQCECTTDDKKALIMTPLSDKNTNHVTIQRECTKVDKEAFVESPLSVRKTNDEKVPFECTLVDKEASKETPLSAKNTVVMWEIRDPVVNSKGPSEVNSYIE